VLAEGAARAAAAAEAPAAPRPRVVLLGATLDDPLSGRIAAELEAMGLDVTRLVIATAVPIEDQVRQAFVSGARAAVVADGHRTEFWVAEEGSDRVALRQELEIETSPGLESVLSLRTVEFLRVSLGLAISGPELPPPAPPPPPPAPPEPPPRFSFELATGVIASSGRLGVFATIAAGLRARLVGPLGLEVEGYAPIGNQTVSAMDGQMDASVWLAGGGLVLAPRMEQRVSAEAGAGVMAVVVHGVGTAAGSATGTSGQAVGLALYGRGAARFRLAPRWSLRLDVMGGSTALRTPLLHDTAASGDYVVTSWGKAFVAGTGGLDIHF